MKKLSIVILSYNTKDLLNNCLRSLSWCRSESDIEVFVVDNASTDGSASMVTREFPWVNLLKNSKNLGFSAGNNKAKNTVKGENILFLNSDTVVTKKAITQTLEYLTNHPEVGAMSCRLILKNGEIDKDSRRRFPTPFNSLKRLFLGMGGEYWYLDVKEDKIQEVDVIQGAFFLSPKKVLDAVGWFDEDYFLNGEDIDLSWKIKEVGYKIIYYPKVSIVHLKKVSKKGSSKRSKKASVDAMEIFYKKRLWNKYPIVLNILVLLGIKLLRLVRSL